MSLVVMSSAAVILPLSLCLGPHFVGSLRVNCLSHSAALHSRDPSGYCGGAALFRLFNQQKWENTSKWRTCAELRGALDRPASQGSAGTPLSSPHICWGPPCSAPGPPEHDRDLVEPHLRAL